MSESFNASPLTRLVFFVCLSSIVVWPTYADILQLICDLTGSPCTVTIVHVAKLNENHHDNIRRLMLFKAVEIQHTEQNNRSSTVSVLYNTIHVWVMLCSSVVFYLDNNKINDTSMKTTTTVGLL